MIIRFKHRVPVVPVVFACCAAVFLVGMFLLHAWLGSRAATNLSETPDAEVWRTNGSVEAIKTIGSSVYIGGDFTRVAPYTGHSALIDAADASVSESFAKAGSTGFGQPEKIAISDGAGGYYIGGDFTEVDGSARGGLAHIDSDGSLDEGWNPAAAGSVVRALWLDGGTLYVGGIFTDMGGETRNNIAALDASTGAATAWDPNASDMVAEIFVSADIVYVGGNFTTIGGASRNSIAALDDTTGLATIWDPDAGAFTSIRTIVVDGSTVYVGGSFFQLGGEAREWIAAVDATTGLATAWDPNADSEVWDIIVDGATVYAAGSFLGIGGTSRRGIVALDATTALATAWDADSNGPVFAIAKDGGTIYAGGDFTDIGGADRSFLAALDTTTALASAWDPGPNEPVYELLVDGASVLALGNFSLAGGVIRNHLAEIDSDGLPTAWDPDVDTGSFGSVNAIDADASTVYIGGEFSSVGGVSRNNIAAVDRTTGLATAWDPDADATVLELVKDGDVAYAAGFFSNIGGASRIEFGAVDATTGLATAWDPAPDSSVMAIAVDGDTVYLGGFFDNVGGAARSRIAAIDADTGLATAWDPGADDTVLTLLVTDGLVYAGGDFTTIGGEPRANLAAVDAGTGLVTAWDPGMDGYVDSLAADADTIFAGGFFFTVGGEVHQLLAAIDRTTGNPTAWNPAPDIVPASLGFLNEQLYVGGEFTQFFNPVIVETDRFARFSIATGGGGGGGSGSSGGPRVEVTDPNGGEMLAPGSSFPITWTTQGRVDLVNVAYSTDAGVTWTTIAQEIPNSGIQSWTVPNRATERARIRVEATDLAGVFASDVSDEVFAILGTQPSTELVDEVSPGDFIQSPNHRGIFFVTESFQRRPFVDAMVFFTYQNDLSKIRQVSDATLSALALGLPMLPKAETVLPRFDGDPDVFAILDESSNGSDPILRLLDSETVAERLYGPAWTQSVLTIDSSLFGFYSFGAPIFFSWPVDRPSLLKTADLQEKVRRHFPELQQAGYLRNGRIRPGPLR